MQQQFWQQRWQEGRLGFHRDEIHPDLLAHEAAFLGTEPRRVLVPLCGKTLDLLWLRDRGHEVVGVEFVEAAAEAFFAEHRITPQRSLVHGARSYSSPGIQIVCADLFAVTNAIVGAIDRIWDRGAMVAIEPARRNEYAQRLRMLTAEGGRMLLNTVEYDQSVMEGPPWSVDEATVRACYSGATIERIERRNVIDESTWRERGHSHWFDNTFLLAFDATATAGSR